MDHLKNLTQPSGTEGSSSIQEPTSAVTSLSRVETTKIASAVAAMLSAHALAGESEAGSVTITSDKPMLLAYLEEVSVANCSEANEPAKPASTAFPNNFDNYGKNFENYAKNFENYAKNFENYGRNFENPKISRRSGPRPAGASEHVSGCLPNGSDIPESVDSLMATISKRIV